MSDRRNEITQLAQQFIAQNNPTGWFEALYSSANGDETAIPWANLTVNYNLATWLEAHQLDGEGRSALVVGCGLGDDAEALAKINFEVTAFDISPTAIEWCDRRFPNSPVNYLVDDLLQPKTLAKKKFDFILESYTLQALPAKIRPQGMESIVNFLAPGGRLLVICRGRDEDEPIGNLPWPLTKSELSSFEELGLTVVKFEDYPERETRPVRRFRVEYCKTSFNL